MSSANWRGCGRSMSALARTSRARRERTRHQRSHATCWASSCRAATGTLLCAASSSSLSFRSASRSLSFHCGSVRASKARDRSCHRRALLRPAAYETPRGRRGQHVRGSARAHRRDRPCCNPPWALALTGWNVQVLASPSAKNVGGRKKRKKCFTAKCTKKHRGAVAWRRRWRDTPYNPCIPVPRTRDRGTGMQGL